jgi:Tol biopolymer transport system component
MKLLGLSAGSSLDHCPSNRRAPRMRVLSRTSVVFMILMLLVISGSYQPIRAADTSLRLIAEPEVAALRFSSDSSYLVYIVNRTLYSAPVGGGSAVALSPSEGAFEFTITSDSRRVVYRGQTSAADSPNVFSVAIEGGTPVKLSTDLAGRSMVIQYALSADSTYVVYQTANSFSSGEPREVFSVPTAGGPAIRLNAPLQPGQGVADATVSFDSSRVVYQLNSGDIVSGQQELWSVPISGGTPVRLFGPCTPDDSGIVWQLDPASRFVIFRECEQQDQPALLYRVALAGGEPVQLDIPDGVSVNPFFQVSSDGNWVVYWSVTAEQGPQDLYRAPVAGSQPAIQLNTETAASRVRSYRISPNSQHVVYLAGTGAFMPVELYSVALSGGAPVKLSGPYDPDGGTDVESPFYITPDSSRVVYAADQIDDFSGVEQLWSVSITASEPAVRISGETIPSAFIRMEDLQISSDSQWVFYRMEGPRDFYYQLFVTSVTGKTPARKLSGDVPTVAGPPYSFDLYSRHFQVSMDNHYVAFAGAPDPDGPRSLYLVELEASNVSVYLPLVVR